MNKTTKSEKVRILIGATGSVDITLLPTYLKEIKRHIDCKLTVLMTPSSAKFIPAETIALFADNVICDESPANWPQNKPSKVVADNDIMAIFPATANTLATIAQGGATNRLTTVVLAADFPVLIFPVMGAVMWQKPAVQRNVKQINEDGYFVMEPDWHENFDAALNKMVGHPSLPAPDEIINLLRSQLEVNSVKAKQLSSEVS